ncbi:MAG: hypothetical protein U0M08_06220 [Clostridia bacterium]|nr:hypothetical protein [Clostridia bacterium]
MDQILETVMLICFGLSWPFSVWKNIKARSAKAMSLPFTILILSGYIAGIAAKIITHNISYVLIAYLLNLIVVSANIIVYFVNLKIDRENIKTEHEGRRKENASAFKRQIQGN